MNEQEKIPITYFDLQDLPEKERFSVWKESISVLFDVTLEARDNEQNFSSQLITCHLGDFLLSNSVSQGQCFRRSRKRVAQDGLDHLLVQIYRKGNNVGICGKTQLDAQPGDVFILDLGQALETRTEDYDNLTLVIPRAILAQYIKFPERLHGKKLAGESVLGQLLREHIETLWHRIGQVSAQESSAIASGLTGLVATYFGGLELPYDCPDIQAVTLETIRQYISQHVADTRLTPQFLASRFGLSRASLYRLFEPLGGPAYYIRQERLQRSLELLTQASSYSIAAIAASVGFCDEAHFSRLFRAAFGMTPGEMRRNALFAKTEYFSDILAIDRRYENWLKTLGSIKG